ncbi:MULTISPECIES: molybdopterin cofactor-binding domain-containing protein [unclassified Marinobacter]|uniref:xanthine dehydrogenase family protein molybdopterin-binding subunit n=1 Tax=unclassified Marinobacter TaxID=83889 RepID=UPI00200C5990|nr:MULTISPECIES: molybdopterin cofactor-binding domain-containing protein [unclassified Marinobacter]UQG58045.1 molybdopterin-dependent oxidoreductase [Marinobacter sp. M4C]UQG66850.1 molybdopterin-dependent oxidoreductase [Marinobacter sp. M2C]UQG71130.1 molybdopterin-dependent oxidoreductase [Marinobacter sp. M1C]
MSRSDDTLLLANVSRRGLLKGLVGGSALLLAARWDLALANEQAQFGAGAMPGGWVDNPNVFIQIDSDGLITIISNRAEMGQGIRTSLAMVAADELGANWDRVRAQQAEGDQDKYGNQNTDGSRSMRHWYEPMRRAAAAARLMLEQAAANQWDVPVHEVRAEIHKVVHPATGRELGFGELAEAARALDVPGRNDLVLKSDNELRFIGKESGLINGELKSAHPKAIDGEDIVTGKAIFGADIDLENTLYAVIARPPVYGAKVKSVDDSEALKVAGVKKVIRIKGASQPAAFNPLGGVAVVASNTWAAMEGRRALKIEWDNTPAGDNADYTSDAYRESLEKAAQSPGKVIRQSGDVETALQNAEKRVSATYYMPHMAQATMEPPVAVVMIKNGKAEAWAPVQHPRAAREGIAGMLEMELDNVTLHQTLLGGGFGRKSKPDFVMEAALVAKEFEGQPIKLQWSREDDIHHAYFHAVSVDHLEAGLDAEGKATSWRHRTLSPSIASLFMPDPKHKGEFELGMGFNTMPFNIPAIRLENPPAPAHVRIGWFRSVYNLPHAWAIQSFAHEMAVAAGKDHRDYVLDLLGPARKIHNLTVGDGWNYGEDPDLHPIDIGRMRRVIERATAEAGWGRKTGKGRGLGLAFHNSFVSYTAIVFDVEVDDKGKLTIHRADIAFDCGPQANPERIRSQMEGSCVMGIGVALQSEVTFKDGVAQQDNFDSYLVPRMPDAPKVVRVHLIDNPNDAMGGVGEPGLPPVAPALCNAIYAATGKRIRRLPVGNQLS